MENRTLEQLITKPDYEYELARANRYRYAMDGDRLVKVRSVGGASFLTGTNVETIYSNPTVGTAKTFGSTGEAVLNDTAGMGPQPIIPPYFFLPGGGNVGKAIRIIARGVYSTTSSPTFTWTTRLGAAASITASIVGITGAITAGTTLSNIAWEQELDVQLTIAASGAASTVRGLGMLSMGLTATTITGGTITGGSAGSATGTVATLDISATNYLNINGNCGSASASNILQVLQLLVFGLN